MDRGMLVPDEITIKMVQEEYPHRIVFMVLSSMVFPGILHKPRPWTKPWVKQSKTIDKVVYIKVSEEELLKRLGGRWICRQCQTPYHEVASPPK